MELFDTHAHLDEPQFDVDRDMVLARAREAGVIQIVAVATTTVSSEIGIELSKKYPGVHPSVGIHPNYAAQATAEDWGRIVGLAADRRVVALGETGLDRHWDDTPWDMQQDYFQRHLRLSRQTGLPVIIHMRDCAQEMLSALQAAAADDPLHGVMHSFTGDAALASQCLALGLHISFAGMATFKKSHDLRAVAATIPADRILVETDSPYLSPHPLRGQRNEPANVRVTAAYLAEVRGVSLEVFAAETTANARRLFRLEPLAV